MFLSPLTKVLMRKMLTRLGIIVALLVTSFSYVPYADAATPCAPRNSIIKHLKSSFSEKLYSRGLVSEQMLMEIYVSKKGSWTILVTSPKGRSCIIASGHTWDQSVEFKGPEA